jgi:hypothetical protein
MVWVPGMYHQKTFSWEKHKGIEVACQDQPGPDESSSSPYERRRLNMAEIYYVVWQCRNVYFFPLYYTICIILYLVEVVEIRQTLKYRKRHGEGGSKNH